MGLSGKFSYGPAQYIALKTKKTIPAKDTLVNKQDTATHKRESPSSGHGHRFDLKSPTNRRRTSLFIKHRW